MTLHSGKWIWPTFREILRDAATPLLLKEKRREATESRVKAMQRHLIKSTGLGYVQKDRVFLLADAGGALVESGVKDVGNACERKFDDRHTLVPPKGFDLPDI